MKPMMFMFRKVIVRGIFLTLPLWCSSCYFNSAGHLFRKAAYDAQLDTAHMGKYVYFDGENYYAEFTRFRVGKKVVTQYDALEKTEKKTEESIPKGVDLCRIPSSFASYLIHGKGEASPSGIEVVNEDQKRLLARCAKMPIHQQPMQTCIRYRYKSPNAFWYYLAGSFDWLCVDLPVTCVENSLAIVLYPALAVMKGLGDGLNEAGDRMNKQAIRMQQEEQMAQEWQIQNAASPPSSMPSTPLMMNTDSMSMPMPDPYTTVTTDPDTGMLTSPALESYNKRMDSYFEYEKRKLEYSTPRY